MGYFLVDRFYCLAYELLGYFSAFIGCYSAQGLLLFVRLRKVSCCDYYVEGCWVLSMEMMGVLDGLIIVGWFGRGEGAHGAYGLWA